MIKAIQKYMLLSLYGFNLEAWSSLTSCSMGSTITDPDIIWFKSHQGGILLSCWLELGSSMIWFYLRCKILDWDATNGREKTNQHQHQQSTINITVPRSWYFYLLIKVGGAWDTALSFQKVMEAVLLWLLPDRPGKAWCTCIYIFILRSERICWYFGYLCKIKKLNQLPLMKLLLQTENKTMKWLFRSSYRKNRWKVLK